MTKAFSLLGFVAAPEPTVVDSCSCDIHCNHDCNHDCDLASSGHGRSSDGSVCSGQCSSVTGFSNGIVVIVKVITAI